MAKRRHLKRDIAEVCTDLMAEVVAISLYDGESNKENLLAIIAAILHIRREFVERVSHVEPGMAAKTYFKDLKDSFNQQIQEVIDHINNIHA